MRKLALLPGTPLNLTHLPAGRGARLSSPSVEFGVTEAIQPIAADAAWDDLSPLEFGYLMAFWRTGSKEGASTFLLDIPLNGPEPVECLAAFSGGLTIGRVTGGSASISGRLLLVPRSAVYPLSTPRTSLIEEIATAV